MRYKAELEETLRTALAKRGCVFCKAALTDKGIVRLDEDGKVTYWKLTEFGQEFLKTGHASDTVQVNEPNWQEAFLRAVLKPEPISPGSESDPEKRNKGD